MVSFSLELHTVTWCGKGLLLVTTEKKHKPFVKFDNRTGRVYRRPVRLGTRVEV